jgi:hypothetical protein
MSLNTAAAAALATARVDVDLADVDPMQTEPISADDVRSSADSARLHGRPDLADQLDQLYGAMLADDHHQHAGRPAIATAIAAGFAVGFLTGPWSRFPVA